VNGARISTRQLDELRGELTDRDWRIMADLDRVRVATGAQLEALHFADVARRRAQRHLAVLAERRILARLPRTVGGARAGSRGHVYALDVAGRRLVDGVAGRRPQRPRTVGRPYLAHALAITDVYVGLVLAERAEQLRIRRFVGEPGCWRSFFGSGGARAWVKPDAYTVLDVDGFEDHWFVEVDCGTEAVSTLERKFAAYLAYARAGVEQTRHEVFPKVLWLVPDAGRTAVLMRVVERQPREMQRVFAVAITTDAVLRLRQGAA
jgi:hypothetical protein